MNYIKDKLGIFEIVAEEVFDDLMLDWNDYKRNNKNIKLAGGRYVATVYDYDTGELLVSKHYRSDYIRSRGTNNILNEARKIKESKAQ